jgi:hypothetical protein
MVDGISDILEGIVDNLSAQAKRALIRSTLPKFIELGYSGNDTLDIYRDAGLGINRSDFFAIRRDILGEETRQQRIRFVNRDSVPTDNIYETYDYDLDTEYRHIIRYSYLDTATGQTKEGFINYDTNFRYTIAELEGGSFQDIQERYPHLQGVVQNTRVWKGFKRSG